jgi:hypothetical protein
MKTRRVLPLAAAVVAAGLGLAACTHVQPSLGQYAIVTGHGALSTQQIKQVVAPGDSVNQEDGTTVWYFPGNYRNYVTLPQNSDRNNPQAVTTGPGPKQEVGMSVHTWTYVGFEVNPAITTQKDHYAVATNFLKFCLKYACATTEAQNDTSNAGQVRSSDPGWENMLNEVMPRAIDDATQTAIQKYGPDLWTNRAQWKKYGTEIADNLTGELNTLSGSIIPYFCGPGSTMTTCTPLSVTIQNVTPVDSDVITQYNKQVSAQYAQQASAARLKVAQALYGPDAYFFTGLQDTIGMCQAKGVTCNIYVGNPPVSAGNK